jgi:hypothetical protein
MSVVEIEVLRDLFRVTEWRDGAVFRTELIDRVWVSPDQAAPVGCVYGSLPVPQIRRKR